MDWCEALLCPKTGAAESLLDDLTRAVTIFKVSIDGTACQGAAALQSDLEVRYHGGLRSRNVQRTLVREAFLLGLMFLSHGREPLVPLQEAARPDYVCVGKFPRLTKSRQDKGRFGWQARSLKRGWGFLELSKWGGVQRATLPVHQSLSGLLRIAV